MGGYCAGIGFVKKHKIYFSIVAAVLAAIFVHKETKRKQNQARSMGRHVPYGPYEAAIKRPLDIAISAMVLVPERIERFGCLFNPPLNSGRAVFAGGAPRRRF